jgi:flagellar biosynthetic protein FliP
MLFPLSGLFPARYYSGMDLSANGFGLLLTLLLCTSFIKIATVLSICRYGLGLVGVEFGVVCLVVALGVSLVAPPPELQALGFPEFLWSRGEGLQVKSGEQSVTGAVVPFMRRRIDPVISEQLLLGVSAAHGGVESSASELRALGPAFVLSELKVAFQLGCLILIPFVIVDLLVAHVLALVGIQQLAVQVVALPLKILLFVASGGWGLLGKKLLGLYG